MKLNGNYRFDITRELLWDALLDPAVVGKCIPGIRNFTTLSPDRYEIEIALQVGIFSGAYKGTLEVVEKAAPASYRVLIQGAGGRTNLKGEGAVALKAEDGATTLTFDGDVQVTGRPRESRPALHDQRSQDAVRPLLPMPPLRNGISTALQRPFVRMVDYILKATAANATQRRLR